MSFLNRQVFPDKLNICLVTKKFPNQGRDADGSYLWPIAQALAKKGHEVTVLSWQNPKGKSEIVDEHVKGYFLGANKSAAHLSFKNLVLRKFSELHRAKPFHIVHSLDDSAFLIAKNRKLYGTVVTFDVSATQMAQVFSILGMAQETLGSLLSTGIALIYKFMTTYYGEDRNLLNQADGVFVSTPLQASTLERYYMYPELKTFIVPYGMDHIETKLRPPSDELRKKLNLPHGGQTILSFSDMNEFEEVANLLRAFQKVVVKRSSSRLIILGNGPLKSKIEYEMLNLALGSKVILAGTISSDLITEYIALSDVYVNLSSRTTGFEPTMLESMAQKKVVLGSELSPIATIIEDGVDGFLVRPADVQGIAELVAALFSGTFKSRNGHLTVQEIGEHARKKVLDLFDVNRMADLMIAAFHKTLTLTNRKPRTRVNAGARELTS
jgi:1,2-diacylglycerol 3-alpha-glucosyltransferase